MAKLPDAIVGARIVGQRFVHAQRRQNPEGRMPLMDHLRELRNRVVKALLGIAAGMVIGFIFFNPVWRFLEHPFCTGNIRGAQGCSAQGLTRLVMDAPLDPFYLRVKVAFIVAVVISSPVWLYQLWAFVAPGLYTREKRWSYIFVGTAVPLFGTGIVLAYLSLGRSLHYLLGLTPGGVSNFINVDTYLSFIMAMMLAFGIAFELPLLIVMLNLAGVLTHARFRKWRRVMIFAVFLIAGMANPSPDPITMLILGGACAALVEVAEVIVWMNDRRRARLHPSPYEGLSDDEASPIELDDAGSRNTFN
ncbi:MAG: twin-arginine translocase subunit TatC [Streptosporangiaceae bacterium]|nr:twin-arginine translocase subunit TatC [Streptosporangiaceae bacterium]MBV9858017.1 twin-arginine translocase subunit TatC [Streptosporangiaceae bacterium]